MRLYADAQWDDQIEGLSCIVIPQKYIQLLDDSTVIVVETYYYPTTVEK